MAESTPSKQTRNRYRCLICRCAVLKLTQHVRSQHMVALRSEYKCKLWGNFGLLGGRYVNQKGRYYKLCPIAGCPSILPDIPRHLRDKHHYSRPASIATSKLSKKIRDLDWTIPRVREGERGKYLDPYPSSAGKKKKRYRRRFATSPRSRSNSSSPERDMPPPREASGTSSGSSSSSSGDDTSSVSRPGSRTHHRAASGSRSPTSSPSLSQPGSSTRTHFSPEKSARLPSRQRVQRTFTSSFYRHLRSVRGGQRSRGYSSQLKSTIHQYLDITKCHSVPRNSINVKCVEKYMKEMYRRDMTSSTLISKLCAIRMFARFLVCKRLMSANQLNRFLADLPGIFATLYKKKRIRSNLILSRQQASVKKQMDLSFFHHNELAIKHIRHLSHGITPQTFRIGRRHLIATLIVDSGARASVIQNMTVEEVDMAEQVTIEDGTVLQIVPVHNHKTAKQGMFRVACWPLAWKGLTVLAQSAKEKFGDKALVFSMSDGREMTTSLLGYEFRMAWLSSGCKAKYGHFNATLNRKRLATKMAMVSPLLSKQLAKQLRHAPSTHQRHYDLVHGAKEAAKILSIAKGHPTIGAATTTVSSTECDQPFAISAGDQVQGPNRVTTVAEIHAPPAEITSFPVPESQPNVPNTTPAPVIEATFSATPAEDHNISCSNTVTTVADIHAPPTEARLSPVHNEAQVAQWILTTDPAMSPALTTSSVSTPGNQRKKWTAEENTEFAQDFKDIISVSVTSGAKPLIDTVRNKLLTLNKTKWTELGANKQNMEYVQVYGEI